MERAIGRLKNYNILKGTFPISMSRLASQIVCVCAYLSNFLPALVPPMEDISDSDIQEYFASISDDEHSKDDSSMSDGD